MGFKFHKKNDEKFKYGKKLKKFESLNKIPK